MPQVKHDETSKPTSVWLGSDEDDIPQSKLPIGLWVMTSDKPLEYDKPMGISVIIAHTALGWSVRVQSGDSYVYETARDAREAVRDWLRHWSESDIRVDEVRNFHPQDPFIPKDGSVPGG